MSDDHAKPADDTHDSEQLKLLFDYTKFHIGLYITLAGVLVAALSSRFADGNVWRLPLALAIVLIAGAGLAGGVIAASLPYLTRSRNIWQEPIGPLWSDRARGGVLRVLRLPVRVWTYLEHSLFWMAVVLVLIGFYPAVAPTRAARVDRLALKDWAQIIQAAVTSVAVMAAGAGWFVFTAKRKQRVAFDLDAHPHRLDATGTVVEIGFIFTNAGYVEHRAYNLTVSVHGVRSTPLRQKDTGEMVFDQRILPLRYLLNKNDYYYIRPGVTQRVTHIIPVSASDRLVRITASFSYDSAGRDVHTSRRVFDVSVPSDIVTT